MVLKHYGFAFWLMKDFSYFQQKSESSDNPETGKPSDNLTHGSMTTSSSSSEKVKTLCIICKKVSFM